MIYVRGFAFFLLLQALLFSATMRLEDSAVDKVRREEFVDSILTVSVEHTDAAQTITGFESETRFSYTLSGNVSLSVTRKRQQGYSSPPVDSFLSSLVGWQATSRSIELEANTNAYIQPAT